MEEESERISKTSRKIIIMLVIMSVPLSGAARGAAPLLPRVHESHKLRRSGPITWCTLCGAYSSNRSFEESVRRTPDSNVFAN